MKPLGIAGWSGSGKTTLIEGLLPLLIARGLQVSVIKQTHHDFQVDQPGKDSWRHRMAGAAQVLLTGPRRWMLVNELHDAPEPSLESHLARLSPCDLVLVEGFKHARLPKLEVWRRELGKPWLHPDDDQFLAVVADQPPPQGPRPLPYLPLDDVPGIAQFILEELNLK
jgi:molybdopterin-guanine dinucleotide biosynthesis protein B